MAERRWTRDDAVLRDDQFTRAPGFRDEHDSDHLPLWDRFSAAWHGMARGNRVVVASALAVLSVAGGMGIFTTLDDFGREVGTQPEAHGPVGAEGQEAPLPAADEAAQDLRDDAGDAPGGLLNGTQAPQPLPGGPGTAP